MSFYLGFDGASRRVNLPTISTINQKIIIDFKTPLTFPTTNQFLLGHTNSTSLISFNSSGRLDFVGGGRSLNVNGLQANTLYTIEVTHFGGVITLTVSGFPSVSSPSGSFTNGTFSRIGATFNTDRLTGEFYSLRVEDQGGELLRNYNPNLSNGLGLILMDEINSANNGELINFPIDNSQWGWNENNLINTGESRVGLGWSPSIRDFASLNLWNTSKNTSTIKEIALCRGSLQTTHITLSSGFSSGAEIKGQVEYTGNNENNLAFTTWGLNLSLPNIVVSDLYLRGTSRFVTSAVARHSTSGFIRCRIRSNGESTSNVGGVPIALDSNLNGAGFEGGFAKNCVISSINTFATAALFQQGYLYENCVIFGGSTYNIHRQELPAIQITRNTFSLLSGRDFIGSPINSASQDLTGNVTGYTNAEFIDFVNGDYRIKTSSPLHALNIGAFFEQDEQQSETFFYSDPSILDIANIAITFSLSYFSDNSLLNIIANAETYGKITSDNTSIIEITDIASNYISSIGYDFSNIGINDINQFKINSIISDISGVAINDIDSSYANISTKENSNFEVSYTSPYFITFSTFNASEFTLVYTDSMFVTATIFDGNNINIDDIQSIRYITDGETELTFDKSSLDISSEPQFFISSIFTDNSNFDVSVRDSSYVSAKFQDRGLYDVSMSNDAFSYDIPTSTRSLLNFSNVTSDYAVVNSSKMSEIDIIPINNIGKVSIPSFGTSEFGISYVQDSFIKTSFSDRSVFDFSYTNDVSRYNIITTNRSSLNFSYIDSMYVATKSVDSSDFDVVDEGMYYVSITDSTESEIVIDGIDRSYIELANNVILLMKPITIDNTRFFNNIDLTATTVLPNITLGYVETPWRINL